MFRYAIKKAFFDLWDHLFFAMAVNLVFTLGLLGLASLSFVFSGLGMAGFLIFVPIPALFAAVLGGVATFWARDIATDGVVKFGDFVPHLKSSWKASLVFGVAWLVLLAGLFIGVPFYSGINSWAGTGFLIVMVWVAFFLAGSGLYYPGLNAQVEPNIKKLVKKSFLVFLAHPGASLVMVVVLLLSVVLTLVTLGFFPGIVGISVWLQVCFRFILKKYEWIEANPEADRKKVPWVELVADDMEKVGPRSLKSMIFPWKD
jgi:uncharacterized membrane protein YesL